MSKVLLVEDEEDLLCVINATFVSEGYETIVAKNGTEGFTKALKEKPELIVADILMPGLNGYDLCRKLREEPSMSGVSIILVTASYKGSETEKLAKDSGADALMAKPFEPGELLRLSKSLLTRPKITS
jgi:DNA-binding response OmpR family regulator